MAHNHVQMLDEDPRPGGPSELLAITNLIDEVVAANLLDLDTPLDRTRLLLQSGGIGDVYEDVSRLAQGASRLHQHMSRATNALAPMSRLPRPALRRVLQIVHGRLRESDPKMQRHSVKSLLRLTQVSRFWRKMAMGLAPYRSLLTRLHAGIHPSQNPHICAKHVNEWQAPLAYFLLGEFEVKPILTKTLQLSPSSALTPIKDFLESRTEYYNKRIALLHNIEAFRPPFCHTQPFQMAPSELQSVRDALQTAEATLRVHHARFTNTTSSVRAATLPDDILRRIFLFCGTRRFADKHHGLYDLTSRHRIYESEVRSGKRQRGEADPAFAVETSVEEEELGSQSQSDPGEEQEDGEHLWPIEADMGDFLPPALLLCNICSHWRQAAIATPGLWARISLNWGPEQQALWLQRAGSAPVEIYMTDDVWGEWESAKLPDSQRLVSVCLDLESLGDDPDVRDENEHCFLAHLARSPLPILSDLELRSSPRPCKHQCTCLDFFTFSSHPSALRRLTLRECQPSSLDFVVSGITHLTLNEVSYGWGEWREVLGACSSLQVLYMNACLCISPATTSSELVRLPELRMFDLHIPRKAVPFLQLVIAPKLRAFVLDTGYYYDDEEVKRIKSFLVMHSTIIEFGFTVSPMCDNVIDTLLETLAAPPRENRYYNAPKIVLPNLQCLEVNYHPWGRGRRERDVTRLLEDLVISRHESSGKPLIHVSLPAGPGDVGLVMPHRARAVSGVIVTDSPKGIQLDEHTCLFTSRIEQHRNSANDYA